MTSPAALAVDDTPRFAPKGYHYLILTVLTRSGGPVANARVSLVRQTGRKETHPQVYTTNAQGQLVIFGPQATHWKMVISFDGFKDQSLSRAATSTKTDKVPPLKLKPSN
jgi:uncharacterized GH25 family protein